MAVRFCKLGVRNLPNLDFLIILGAYPWTSGYFEKEFHGIPVLIIAISPIHIQSIPTAEHLISR